MPQKDENYTSALDEIKYENQHRTLSPILLLDETQAIIRDKKILNFASHDCLGLSFHPSLQKSAIKFILQYGSSSTTSPTPNTVLYCLTQLEDKIALALGTEEALIMPSRFLTNTGVLSTLAPSNSLLFIDSSCHSSLKYGAQYSSARVEWFPRHQLDHLSSLLQKAQRQETFSKIIVTESIDSLEGNLAPIEPLINLAKEYGALLYVDDTHAFGAMGEGGMGLAAKKEGIDIVVGSFYHGGGASLSYVGCSAKIKEYLINFCPALKDNPLPLAALGAIEAALDLIPELEGERKQLEQRAYFLRRQLQGRGLSTGTSNTHLVPLFLESNEKTSEMQKDLLEMGIYVEALLTPHVPQGASRLLFALSAHHTPEHLTELLDALTLQPATTA